MPGEPGTTTTITYPRPTAARQLLVEREIRVHNGPLPRVSVGGAVTWLDVQINGAERILYFFPDVKAFREFATKTWATLKKVEASIEVERQTATPEP